MKEYWPSIISSPLLSMLNSHVIQVIRISDKEYLDIWNKAQYLSSDTATIQALNTLLIHIL
jgi:hypothetical protein